MDNILLTPEAQKLANFMTDLSQWGYYASWLIDLEYKL